MNAFPKGAQMRVCYGTARLVLATIVVLGQTAFAIADDEPPADRVDAKARQVLERTVDHLEQLKSFQVTIEGECTLEYLGKIARMPCRLQIIVERPNKLALTLDSTQNGRHVLLTLHGDGDKLLGSRLISKGKAAGTRYASTSPRSS